MRTRLKNEISKAFLYEQNPLTVIFLAKHYLSNFFIIIFRQYLIPVLNFINKFNAI